MGMAPQFIGRTDGATGVAPYNTATHGHPTNKVAVSEGGRENGSTRASPSLTGTRESSCEDVLAVDSRFVIRDASCKAYNALQRSS